MQKKQIQKSKKSQLENNKVKIEGRILEIVHEFIQNYYPDSYATMISGSVADGKSHIYSDIDVLIFDKNIDSLYMETLSYKGEKIQAIVLPVHKIDEILLTDYNSSRGAFLEMLPKGVVLSDTSGFLKNLVDHTKKLKTTGCPPLNDAELKALRVELTSMLLVVKGNKGLQKLIFPISKLIETLSDFKLKVSGNWVGAPKHKMDKLRKIDQGFVDEFIAGVECFYKMNDKSRIVRLVEKTLDEYGGEITNYSNSTGKRLVSRDYLVLELNCPYLSDFTKVKSEIIKIKECLNNYHQIESYYFLLHKSVKDIVQNVYIVIKAPKDCINDFLIKDLNREFRVKKMDRSLVFPFDFDPEYQFSSKDIYEMVLPAFYEGSGLLLSNTNNMFDRKFQAEFVLGFFKAIRSIWFKNDTKKFESFLSYLFECWLILSYDNGTLYNTERLLKKREKTLEIYNSCFKEQEGYLCDTFSEVEFEYSKIRGVLDAISIAKDIETIPKYKAYLLENLVPDIEARKWAFYKEFIKRLLSVTLVDNTEFAYWVFVLQNMKL